jgi:uncharacterized protein (TIGR02271 family)
MPLSKLKDFDPNYREALNGNDIHGFSVYAEGTDEKVGSVDDLLVDEDGSFRYLIVDLGFWIFGKKVLLPIGRSRINFQEQRVYALGMTKQQAENLPEFSEDMAVDYDYEERVRGAYRPSAAQPLDTTTPLDTSAPLDAPYTTTEPSVSTPGSVADSTSYGSMADPTMPVAGTSAPMDTPYLATEPGVSTPDPVTGQTGYPSYDRDTYSYQQDPDLYGLRDQDHQNLRLYEERLIASKRRQKTGEVAVGKRVETETSRVSVPVEKERVVIERTTPTDAGTQVTPGEASFQSGEVARMEVYEETADVRKEAFVREEINVRKEVDRDTVDAEETIRREELDVDAQGRSIEDRTGRNPDSLI